MPYYQAYKILSIVVFPVLAIVSFATVFSNAASYWRSRRIVEALYAISNVFAGLAFLARFYGENAMPSYTAAYDLIEIFLWVVFAAVRVVINAERWAFMYTEGVDHVRLTEIRRSEKGTRKMKLRSILDLVWGRYGLVGAIVVVALLVALDQLYGYGFGEMIAGFLK